MLRRGPRGPALALALAAVVAAAGRVPAARAEDGSAPGRDPASVSAEPKASLAALDSPFLRERTEAVERLTASLPVGREAVLEAFRTGAPPRRALLAPVLAADPGRDAEALLLGALATSKDIVERRAVRAALVSLGTERIEAAKTFLSAQNGSAEARAEFEVLEQLAKRDRVETLFLAKKSRSGATGFYKGQFEDLRPYRDTAVEVLEALVMNRGLRVPGVFPAGSYRFLHPPPFLVEPGELRDIAANGLSELAPKDPADPTSVDDATLLKLLAMAKDLDQAAQAQHGRRGKGRLRLRGWLLTEEDDLLNVVLVTLALARPDSDAPSQVEERADVYRGQNLLDSAAMLYMRLQKYDRAIELYEQEIERGESLVLPWYNIACAHAKWSEDLKASNPRAAAKHRAAAMSAIETSVHKGYADWPWMEQDRDLDAVRSEPGYPKLVEEMKAAFSPEAVRKALGEKVDAPAMGGR